MTIKEYIEKMKKEKAATR